MTLLAAPRRAVAGIYRGWWVAAGALIAYLVYSMQFNSVYGVFIYHLGNEMGWSRSALVGVATLARLPEAGLAPFVGSFVDRHGSRNVLLVGSFIVGIALILLATVQEIWQLYLYKGVLLALGVALTSPLVFGITVNNWFVEKRGRVTGFIRMGDTIGTIAMPVIAALLIETLGWRWAFALLGIGAVVVLAPTSRLFHRRPEDLGLLPDGAAVDGGEPKPRSERAEARRAELLAADVVWSRREAIRTPTLWALVFAYGLAAMGVVSMNLHLVPYVQELGYSITVAAAAVSARGFIGFVSNPLWGLLIERVSVQPAGAGAFLLAAAAMGVFLLPNSELSLGAALLIFGLASTGFYTLNDVIWANFFGRISLGTVRGIAHPITAAFSALGPLAVGLLYDGTGGYRVAWIVLLVGFLAAAGLILTARRPRRKATADVAEDRVAPGLT